MRTPSARQPWHPPAKEYTQHSPYPELGLPRQKRPGGAYIPLPWPIYPVVGGIVPNPARVIPPESAPTRERYINHSKVQSPKCVGGEGEGEGEVGAEGVRVRHRSGPGPGRG